MSIINENFRSIIYVIFLCFVSELSTTFDREMKKLFFLAVIVLQGALSASLPASNNPNENLDSFLKNFQDRLAFGGNEVAGFEHDDDKTEVEDDEDLDGTMEDDDVKTEVQNVPLPPNIKSYGLYCYLNYAKLRCKEITIIFRI